ncbi:MAG: hypothetical protein E7091_10475 [Bacteroidales bacterium]|nr:hypothetical protein [Bacteroidales bacterium]
MQHFTIQELSASATAERLAIDNTPPRAAQRMLTILVEQLLDPIRRRYGAPIIVTSGYRCPALNTAVGGVANSHHIVGCAADITTGSVENNTMLFALIIDMQTTYAIRFTQLIAEKDYRWLHISYVPGMLRNQIIDVNACASERNASSLAIAQRTQPSVCDEVTNDNVNQSSGSQEGDVVALLSEAKASAVVNAKRSTRSRTDAPSASASALSLEEKSALTLKKDYQDSG